MHMPIEADALEIDLLIGKEHYRSSQIRRPE